MGINPDVLQIKDDKDAKIIDMKLRGCANATIAEATDMPTKTIANITTKGGRLFPIIQSLRNEKTVMLQQGNLSGLESLLEAKDPAIQELIRLIQESPNDIVRLRGIDMLLEMTGIHSKDRPPLLDPLDMEKSVNRLLKWVNERLIMVYRDRAPVISLWDTGLQSSVTFDKEDVDRIERAVDRLEAMRRKEDVPPAVLNIVPYERPDSKNDKAD